MTFSELHRRFLVSIKRQTINDGEYYASLVIHLVIHPGECLVSVMKIHAIKFIASVFLLTD